MNVVTLRLPPVVVQRMEALAPVLTRSQLLRRLVALGLERAEADPLRLLAQAQDVRS